ncbi:kelch domain-containing protein 7B [Ochotona princeps]|uniref:kelch domain-containing protein 7B n=1 Tax=Ochotona princeps TaxID=9978 RepID=UPI002714DE22|nr:kelch domain-containing protein 7B [Ochotona princeps]
MSQGTLEAGGPLWGWDWDADDDWEGAVLAVLALAVVAATALALHWFGPQDQQTAGPTTQAAGVGPALHLKAQVSGGREARSPEQGKPGPPTCSHSSPTATIPAQGCEPPGGAVLHPQATLRKGALGPQQSPAKEPPGPGADLPGRDTRAAGLPAPVVIHFTPREVEAQLEAGGGREGLEQRGRGRSRRRQVDAGSGDRTRRRPKPDPLCMGAVPSVWDVVETSASAGLGTAPRELSQGRAPHLGAGELGGSGETWPWTPRAVPGGGGGGGKPAASSLEGPPRDHLPSPQQPDKAQTKGLESAHSALGPAPVGTEKPGASRQGGGTQEGQAPEPWDAGGSSLNCNPSLTSNPSPSLTPSFNYDPSLTSSFNYDPSLTSNPSLTSYSSLTPIPVSGPRPVPQEARVALSKGSQERQVSASWGTLIAMVLRSHPFPKQEKLPGRDAPEEKSSDSQPPAALPKAPSQPGPALGSQPVSQPVSQPGTRSLCELAQSCEQETVGQGTSGLSPGQATKEEAVTQKQREARKLLAFLQRPGSWGVAEGVRDPCTLEPARAAALRRRLDLGNCLDVLALAQRRGDASLARETYAVMSNNLLHVLGDAQLYRQLSGADRQRILNLRTGRGRTVLGVLVLPSLYPVSRLSSGAEEPAPAGPTQLHVFSPQENSWWPLTRVPDEAPLRGCGLCTMHNYLFLAGGIRGSGTKAVCSNQVFCYNPLTDIWSQVRPMQQARAQLKLVALDGLLYAIGGECLYSMECYDPRTDAWTPRAPLPAGTFPVAHEAVACRGDIYVTGGHLFYRLLRYNPRKDSWDECPYSASHRRSSDMVALGGFLYRFDLLRGVGAAVMRYNTVTGSWSRAASLPLPDPAPLRCAVLGNTIYCLNHQVTATFTISEGTAQFQAQELQPFPLGSKGTLSPFLLTLPSKDPLQTSL